MSRAAFTVKAFAVYLFVIGATLTRVSKENALEAVRGIGEAVAAARAAQQGHRIVEVPIVFRDRRLGKSKMSGDTLPERSMVQVKEDVRVVKEQMK